MLIWHLGALALDLRFTWKISRNVSETKTNLFVHVSDGKFTGAGEAAPNIRFQETPEILQQQFKNLMAAGLEQVQSLEDLTALLKFHRPANALRFAVESAYVHYLCQQQNLTVPEFLGLPAPQPIATTFSLPIMELAKLESFIRENNLTRFRSLKVKVNRETGLETVQEISKHYGGPLLVDTNEAWLEPETLLIFLENLRPYNILFIEQPMPATEADGYIYLKQNSPYAIYADESILDEPDFDALEKQFHGVNMKLMKAGGYLKGKYILEEAQKRGLQTMIGCMVETSLGISSALQLGSLAATADLDGFLIMKEDPFEMVREQEGRLYLND